MRCDNRWQKDGNNRIKNKLVHECSSRQLSSIATTYRVSFSSGASIHRAQIWTPWDWKVHRQGGPERTSSTNLKSFLLGKWAIVEFSLINFASPTQARLSSYEAWDSSSSVFYKKLFCIVRFWNVGQVKPSKHLQ